MSREVHARTQDVSGAKSRQRIFGHTQRSLHLTSGE
jgi:hypothetical protein